MRAILIDPYTRTVTEIDHDGTLDGLYKTLQCDTVDAVQVGPRDTLWLDDEGFLQAGRPVYRLGDSPTPLAGRGLILGVGKDGNERATTIPLTAVARTVKWTDLESTGDFHQGGIAEGGDGETYDFIVRGGSPMLRKRENPTPEKT